VTMMRVRALRLSFTAVLLLDCSLVREPTVVSAPWFTAQGLVLGPVARHAPGPGAPRAQPVSPPVAHPPVTFWPSRVRVTPIPDFDWGGPGPSLPGTLDLVRAETGEELRPQDFPSGRVESTLLAWPGGSWSLPPWLRTSVKNKATPWGNDFEVNLFFHWDDWKVMVGLRNQATFSGYIPTGYFPGMTVELYEFPLRLSHQAPLFTSRVSFWTQPTTRSLGFSQESWGALGSLTLEIPLEDNLWLWVEGRAKTPGWVADNLDVGTDLAVKTGLHWSL